MHRTLSLRRFFTRTRDTFECCRGSCQGRCVSPERFSFHAPTKVEGAGAKIERLLAVELRDGGKAAALEEAKERELAEDAFELYELMTLREEGQSSSSGGG